MDKKNFKQQNDFYAKLPKFQTDLMEIRNKYLGCQFRLESISEDYKYLLIGKTGEKNTNVFEKIYKPENKEKYDFIQVRIYFEAEHGFLRNIEVIRYFKNLHKNDIFREFCTSLPVEAEELVYLLEKRKESDILKDYSDVERITEKYSLVNEIFDDPVQRKFCILANKVRDDYKENEYALIARGIIAAIRGIDKCLWPEYLTKIAEYASLLNMKAEGLTFVRKAFELKKDFSFDDWYRLGYIFYNLSMIEESFDSFVNSIILNPEDKDSKNNLKIIGKNLLKTYFHENLSDKGLKTASILMQNLKSNQVDFESDILSYVGLCYEYKKDLKEASKYYDKAISKKSDNEQAIAGIERLKLLDEYREAEFEVFRQSYPIVPDPETLGKIPTKVVESVPHGSHWDTIVSFDAKTFANFISEHIKTAEVFKTVKFKRVRETDENLEVLIAFLNRDESTKTKLCRFSISGKYKNKDSLNVLSAYPFSMNINEMKMKIIEIEEQEGGIEACLECKTDFGSTISFFDAMYFEDRIKYKVGNLYTFTLAGFAYTAEIANEDDFWEFDDGAAYEIHKKDKLKENPNLTEAEIGPMRIYKGFGYLIPSTKFKDDHGFRIKAEKIHELKFEGKTVYGIEAVLTKNSDDDNKDLNGIIYIAKDKFKGMKPKIGDIIEGSMWLQGTMVNIFENQDINENSDIDFMNLGGITSIRKQSETEVEEKERLIEEFLRFNKSCKNILTVQKKLKTDPIYAVLNNKNIMNYIFLDFMPQNHFPDCCHLIKIELTPSFENYYDMRTEGWNEFISKAFNIQ